MSKLSIVANHRDQNSEIRIYIHYFHRDRGTSFSTGIKINKNYFDQQRHCLLKTTPEYHLLNNIVTEQLNNLNRIVLKLRLKNIEPTTFRVRDEFKRLYKNNAPEITDLIPLFERFIDKIKAS